MGETQTRRVVKHEHIEDIDAFAPDTNITGQWRIGVAGDFGKLADYGAIRCPYGAAGDRLWVREAWRSWSESHHDHHTDDEECDEHCRQVYVAYRSTPRVGFRPTPDRAAITYLDESTPIESNRNLLGPWKPGIHLRRDHARIVLDVVKVRVERLQDISEADAIAEGVHHNGTHWTGGRDSLWPTARAAFESLWCGINGVESWRANPWVWVIEFRRVSDAAKEAA